MRFSVTGFAIEGDSPLAEEDVREILSPFIGDYESIDGLIEATNVLEQQLIERGFSFYRVLLPPQKLSGGVVKLSIISFSVGEVFIDGNEFFTNENILRSLPSLELGQPPRTKKLSQERLHANQHPSKQIELRFKESKTAKAVDAHIQVEDSRPLNAFFTLNNTGSDETGDLRATVGLQHSNLFGWDHIFTGTYTRSPDKFSKVEQWGVTYVAPIYQLGGTFGALYVESDVDSGTVADTFDVSGSGEFFGASYTHFLERHGAYTHNATLGFEDKRFDNNVVNGATNLGVDVRSRPVSLTYNGNYSDPSISAGGYTSYVHNIPGSGAKNDGDTYNASRIGADDNWGLFRFGGFFDYPVVADFLVRGRFDAQSANEPLIAGEQFGLGGSRSVRGYEEREISGDSGFAAALEAWTPVLLHNARALAFVDHGLISRRNNQPGEKHSDSLSSIGAGLRWFWKTHVSARVDIAVALDNARDTDSGDVKAHFELLLRY